MIECRVCPAGLVTAKISVMPSKRSCEERNSPARSDSRSVIAAFSVPPMLMLSRLALVQGEP